MLWTYLNTHIYTGTDTGLQCISRKVNEKNGPETQLIYSHVWQYTGWKYLGIFAANPWISGKLYNDNVLMLQDTELNLKLGCYHSCAGIYNEKQSVLLFESSNDFSKLHFMLKVFGFYCCLKILHSVLCISGLQINSHEGMIVIHIEH